VLHSTGNSPERRINGRFCRLDVSDQFRPHADGGEHDVDRANKAMTQQRHNVFVDRGFANTLGARGDGSGRG